MGNATGAGIGRGTAAPDAGGGRKMQRESGMERLDIFLEYGEKLSEGRQLAPQEQEALLAAVAASLPEQEQKQLTELMKIMGV